MKSKSLIPEVWEVPAEFRARVGGRPGRQRVMQADGHLLLVLHEPPRPDEPTRRPRLFWRKPTGEWSSTAAGNGLAAFEQHLEEFNTAIDRCDRLEDSASSANEYFDVLDQVSPLKRTVEHLHQVLQEARRLEPGDRNIINLRDQCYDLSRTAELLYDATKNAMEMAQTRRAEEQAAASMEMAASAHRLNWLVALFFPLATLTGVFGMQLATGLESYAKPWPMVAVCIVGLVFGVILSSLVIRPPRRPAGKG